MDHRVEHEEGSPRDQEEVIDSDHTDQQPEVHEQVGKGKKPGMQLKRRPNFIAFGTGNSFFNKPIPDSEKEVQFKQTASAPTTPHTAKRSELRHLPSSVPTSPTASPRVEAADELALVKYHQSFLFEKLIAKDNDPEFYRRLLVYKTARFRPSDGPMVSGTSAHEIVHRKQFLQHYTSQLNGIQALKFDAAQVVIETLFSGYDQLSFTQATHCTYQLFAKCLLDMSMCTNQTDLQVALRDGIRQLTIHYNQLIQSQLLPAPGIGTVLALPLQEKLLPTFIEDLRVVYALITLCHQVYHPLCNSHIPFETIKPLWIHDHLFSQPSQVALLEKQLASSFDLSRSSFELNKTLLTMVNNPPGRLIVEHHSDATKKSDTKTYLSIKSLLATCSKRVSKAQIAACVAMLMNEQNLLEEDLGTHYIPLSAVQEPFFTVVSSAQSVSDATQTTIDAFNALMDILKTLKKAMPCKRSTHTESPDSDVITRVQSRDRKPRKQKQSGSPDHSSPSQARKFSRFKMARLRKRGVSEPTKPTHAVNKKKPRYLMPQEVAHKSLHGKLHDLLTDVTEQYNSFLECVMYLPKNTMKKEAKAVFETRLAALDRAFRALPAKQAISALKPNTTRYNADCFAYYEQFGAFYGLLEDVIVHHFRNRETIESGDYINRALKKIERTSVLAHCAEIKPGGETAANTKHRRSRSRHKDKPYRPHDDGSVSAHEKASSRKSRAKKSPSPGGGLRPLISSGQDVVADSAKDPAESYRTSTFQYGL